MQNNAGDNLTTSTNGAFTFATSLGDTATYSVMVLTQPTGQFCSVMNGSGTISASNITGIAVSCSTINGNPPAAPSAPSATPLSESSTGVTWSDNSSDETGFYVERGATASGPFTQIKVPANITTYTDSGLTASTKYYYRIAALNNNGISPYTVPISTMTNAAAVAAPAAPSGLTAVATTASSILLKWTDNSVDESGFKVERGTSAAGPFTLIATAATNATSFSDSGLVPATTYYYQIRATNGAADSANTAVSLATTLATVTVPATPSNPIASTTSASSITLSWTDKSTDETEFKVEFATKIGGPFTLLTTTGADIKSINHTGLSASTEYFYQVCATNSAGDSAFTPVASAITSAPSATPPAAPSNLVAAGVASSTILLAWSDNSDNETGFLIERAKSAAGPFTQVATTATNVTNFRDTGLVASTAYYYQIRATNGSGTSLPTSVATATTQTPAIVYTVVDLYPVMDNTVAISSLIPATQTTSYPTTNDLAVGCNWFLQWNPISFNWMQQSKCAQSLVKFDVSALAGKTIDSATLTLKTYYTGVGFLPRNWYIGVLISPWNATVNWDTAINFTYDLNSKQIFSAPTSINQVYNINLTSVVQAWAGGWTNNGLILETTDYLFPYADSWDMFAFYSSETGIGWGPTLQVTYH